MRHGATLLCVSLVFASISVIVGAAAPSDTAVMRVGNVLGDPAPGQEPHHMVRTQRYFAKLVWEKTGGSVEVRFLEGKSLPTFQMAGGARRDRSEVAVGHPDLHTPHLRLVRTASGSRAQRRRDRHRRHCLR